MILICDDTFDDAPSEMFDYDKIFRPTSATEETKEDALALLLIGCHMEHFNGTYVKVAYFDLASSLKKVKQILEALLISF